MKKFNFALQIQNFSLITRNLFSPLLLLLFRPSLHFCRMHLIIKKKTSTCNHFNSFVTCTSSRIWNLPPLPQASLSLFLLFCLLSPLPRLWLYVSIFVVIGYSWLPLTPPLSVITDTQSLGFICWILTKQWRRHHSSLIIRLLYLTLLTSRIHEFEYWWSERERDEWGRWEWGTNSVTSINKFLTEIPVCCYSLISFSWTSEWI